MAFDAGKFSQIKFQGVRNNNAKIQQPKGEVETKNLPADPKESFQFGDKPLVDVKAGSALIGKPDSDQAEVGSQTKTSTSSVSNSPMILDLNSVGTVKDGGLVQPKTFAFANKVGDPTLISASGKVLASNSIFTPVSDTKKVPNTSLDAINSTFEMTTIETISGKPAGVVPVPTTSLDALNGIESKEFSYVGSGSVF